MGAAPPRFGRDAGDLTGWTTSSNNDSNNILFHPSTDAATRHDGAEFGFWSSSGVIASPGGGNFVAFDGDPQGGAQQSVMQTISGLTVGETYKLTFDWAATQYQFVDGAGPPFSCSGCWSGITTNEIEVSLGGGVPQDTAVVDNIPAKGFTGWMPETFNFTATAASEVLKFVSIGAPSGNPPSRSSTTSR